MPKWNKRKIKISITDGGVVHCKMSCSKKEAMKMLLALTASIASNGDVGIDKVIDDLIEYKNDSNIRAEDKEDCDEQ